MNEIRRGNCLELLEDVKDNSIDLLVTDPPFAVGVTSNGQKGSWNDNKLITPFFERYFDEILRVLKDGAEFYINTDWRTYPLLYPIITERLVVRNCIVWDYEWIKAGTHYRFSHEFIIYGTKGKGKRKFDGGQRDVWRIKPINFTSKDKWHQAEKPLQLVKTMILNSSKEGDLILDTFLGSGTTAIACHQTKRKFLGFEIDPKQYNNAVKRIKESTSQVFLF